MKLSTVTLCTSAALAWAGSPLTSALFAVAWLFHRRWEKTLSSDSGQDIAEYAVMLAVILIIVIGVVKLIGVNSQTVFSQVSSSLAPAQ